MSTVGNASNSTYGLKQNDLDEINQSFHAYDLDNNGYISRNELKQCLGRANVVAPDAIVESVIKQMDLNHDDKISYDEYLKFMATIYRDEHTDLKRKLGNATDYVGSASGLF